MRIIKSELPIITLEEYKDYRLKIMSSSRFTKGIKLLYQQTSKNQETLHTTTIQIPLTIKKNITSTTPLGYLYGLKQQLGRSRPNMQFIPLREKSGISLIKECSLDAPTQTLYNLGRALSHFHFLDIVFIMRSYSN